MVLSTQVLSAQLHHHELCLPRHSTLLESRHSPGYTNHVTLECRDVILGGWYIDFPAFEPPEGLAFSVMQSESVVQVPGTRQVHLSLGGPSHMAVVFKV